MALVDVQQLHMVEVVVVVEVGFVGHGEVVVVSKASSLDVDAVEGLVGADPVDPDFLDVGVLELLVVGVVIEAGGDLLEGTEEDGVDFDDCISH